MKVVALWRALFLFIFPSSYYLFFYFFVVNRKGSSTAVVAPPFLHDHRDRLVLDGLVLGGFVLVLVGLSTAVVTLLLLLLVGLVLVVLVLDGIVLVVVLVLDGIVRRVRVLVLVLVPSRANSLLEVRLRAARLATDVRHADVSSLIILEKRLIAGVVRCTSVLCFCF